MSINRFKYYININDGVDVEVELITSSSQSRDFKREERQLFLRPELSQSFTINKKSDYDLIQTAAFDSKFTLTINRVDLSGNETLLIKGEFFKTDISEFDEDSQKIVFKAATIDRYLNIVANLETEYNLIDIAPEVVTVKYKKEPIIQVYINSANFITNFLGGSYWETPVTNPVPLDSDLLNVYKFAVGRAMTIVTGDDSVLTPDVSGIYDNTTGLRTDGLYQLTNVGFDRFKIRLAAAPQTVLYSQETTDFPFSDSENPFARDNVFISETDPAVKCRASRFIVWARLLTDADDVLGTSTFDIPANDIIGTAFGYKKVVGLSTDNFEAFSTHQTEPTRWGKYRAEAVNFAGEYFSSFSPAPSSGIDNSWPVAPSDWRDFSLWFYYDAPLRIITAAAQTDLENASCYKLSDALSAILGEIDPSITHEESVDYSALFYDTVNPITGVKTYPIITQKENVTVGDYDQAAQKAPIRLSYIFDLLRFAYNAYWYIDANNKLKIEHYRFFHNGGDYSTEQIGLDTTTDLHSFTRYPWSFATNKYKYNKQEIPQEIVVKWMDKQSPAFEGYPVKLTSRYVDKGNIDERSIGWFSTDVAFLQTQPGDVSKDGFVLFEAVVDGGDFVLPFVELVVDTDERYTVQNGYASLIFSIDKYYRDGLPAKNATINRITTIVANSVLRTKEGEPIDFPMPESLDTIKLVKTGLGNGMIKEISETLDSGIAKITLLYEPE